MDFDAAQIGTHAGSGVLGSLITFFGMRERIKRTEEDLKDLKNSSVSEPTCTMCKTNTKNQFKAFHDVQVDMNKKLDILLSRSMK